MARDSAAVSITDRDLGISDFILVSWELLMVSLPTLEIDHHYDIIICFKNSF